MHKEKETIHHTQLPKDKELVLKTLTKPSDSNINGDIFGGWIMSQVDVAGAVLPWRIASGRIVTVAVNHFIFKQPVYVGDLVSLYAVISRIGTTSMTVDVEVFAESVRNQGHLRKVTEATVTYVHTDAKGKPIPLPKPSPRKKRT